MNAGRTLPVGLTALQSRAYAFIWTRVQTGPAPSYDEIAAHLGQSSKGNICRLVQCLVERGYLVKRQHSARSIRLAPNAPVPVAPGASAGNSVPNQVTFASPLVDDLRAQARREHRDVSALLEDAVALYLRTAA
ncbi:LexA family protein [Methylobacterium aquaticum]|uniref:LexA family protein n=1 Tax=Methylobacterium aquaticum TaxID=270351 RepID=UPI003D17E532